MIYVAREDAPAVAGLDAPPRSTEKTAAKDLGAAPPGDGSRPRSGDPSSDGARPRGLSGVDARELVAEGGSVTVRAETPVSRDPAGPFEPLARAVEIDPGLRDELERAAPTPSVRAWHRVRPFVALLVAVPCVTLLELDRELAVMHGLGPSRVLVDLLLVAWIVFELTRRTPRFPAVAACASAAIGARFVVIVGRSCARDVHLLVGISLATAAVASAMFLVFAPSRARTALEILGKLGVSRSDAYAVTRSAPPNHRSLGAAIIAASLFPAVLSGMRAAGANLWLQMLVFAVYGAAVPEIVARVLDDSPPRTTATFVPLVRTRRHAFSSRPAAVLFAIALGLTLTAALVQGTHHFFDGGAALARCVGRLDAGTQRLVEHEAAEVARRIRDARASTTLAFATVIVMPFVEERIFRGLLASVLVRKYGRTYGLFASAAAFGIAHVGIYEVALWQTFLLGIGFGVAWLEGGVVAAFVVHGVWNLLQLA